jgi:hypothetical protein
MRFIYTFTIFITAIFILFVIAVAIQPRDLSPEPPGPPIYITRTDRIRTIEGREIWILEYTIDGVLQSPAFNSREAMTEYREYLDSIGKVYQGEEE